MLGMQAYVDMSGGLVLRVGQKSVSASVACYLSLNNNHKCAINTFRSPGYDEIRWE